MKKAITCITVCLITVLLFPMSANSAETPNPFGFKIAKTSYPEALSILQSKDWDFREYTKKDFKEIGKTSPDKGKNTFLMVKTKKLEGINGIRLFFNDASTLDAIIIVMDPKMFPPVMDVLNHAAVKRILNKRTAMFGSYGWSGGALRNIKQIIEPIKWELEDSFEFNGSPDGEDLKKAREFGRNFAGKIKNGS